MKLEVEVIPVSDVERAKQFYQGLGWRLDGDFPFPNGLRVVQMTPPGSPSSIMFGNKFTAAQPGSHREMFLVVDDIDVARKELLEKGIDVSEVFHFEGGMIRFNSKESRVPGRDPQNRSYSSFASFDDPDGNTWLVQEVTARLPGRGLGSDLATLTALLKETEDHHGAFEKTGAKHHWSTWYAAYMVARENGKTPDEASNDAALHVKSVTH
jgi:catechol 2,3-dioxygenase-like lactoylglutathione lyase family enzyme